MSSLPPHVIWRSEGLVASLSPHPCTPGCVTLQLCPPGPPGRSVFQLEEHRFLQLLLGAQSVSQLLCRRLGVLRCALVHRPHRDTPAQIRILPLHGLASEWRPHLAGEEDYNAIDPGYISSRTAPRWPSSRLSEIQTRIRAQLPEPNAPQNLSFLGVDPADPGLFPRIIRGEEEEQWRVWEDQSHVAFLTPFPNSPGFTVLVPRRPLTSDIFRLEKQDYEGLVLAALKVARLLEVGLGASGVGLIFEGFEIDYAHAKLIPLLASEEEEEDAKLTAPPQFYPTYPGYVSSEDGPEASEEDLKELHRKITRS
ncbi:hypothetical protein CesoFtcFv8_008260 [Champsocephalus esox]|uniref:HIT domain-containing protein n=1 Tax=Champsocephalus esox TaxID=159716 RepID=A0AAN8CA84_9TELE|nr:hypothetical protein CesoFtcFv8_008260 [Champsocephalus esox]